MKKEELLDIVQDLELDKNITLNEIPEIDLYMDQVIQLFENKFEECKRNEDDKVLTKTMINNYAKGKLLMPVKNKKYSKEHLILMSLIYNLKGALSISDIKSALDNIVKNHGSDNEIDIREIYNLYLELSKNDLNEFKDELSKKSIIIENRVKESEKLIGDFEGKFLLLCSMINMSNMYRRMGEKLIDEFFKNDLGDIREK